MLMHYIPEVQGIEEVLAEDEDGDEDEEYYIYDDEFGDGDDDVDFEEELEGEIYNFLASEDMLATDDEDDGAEGEDGIETMPHGLDSSVLNASAESANHDTSLLPRAMAPPRL